MDVSLLSPGSIKGMMSAQNPMALPDGFVALSQNARHMNGAAVARYGDAIVKSGIATGEPRGAYECYMDGTQNLFVAIASSSKVSIYRSTDNGTTWANVSPTSGAYGDTRLTDSSTVPVRFQVVKDRPFGEGTANDILVIQNGIDSPRIYAKGITGGTPSVNSNQHPNAPSSSVYTGGTYGMAVVTTPLDITSSASVADLQVYPGFLNSFPIGSTLPTVTNVTGFTIAYPNLHFLEMTISNTYVTGTMAKAKFTGSSLDGTLAKGFYLIGFCADDSDWANKLYVSVVDQSGNETQIYPSIGSGVSGFVTQVQTGTTATDNGRMVGYPLSISTAATFNWDDVESIKFGYSEVPASTLTVVIACAGFQGQVQGGASYGVTSFSADTRQESPSTIIANYPPGTFGWASGYNYDYSVPGAPAWGTIPNDPRFYYDFAIVFKQPTSTQRDAGINYYNIYRSDYGQTNYYFVSSQVVCYYDSGAWKYSGYPSATSPKVVYWQEGVYSTLQDFSKVMPDSNAYCLQIGTAMCMANSRLFSTALLGGSVQKLLYSEIDRPFMFRDFVRFTDSGVADSASGGSITFDGEVIQSMVPVGVVAGGVERVSSLVTGNATIYILTNANVYGLTGFDALSLNKRNYIGPYGTLSPLSVARSQIGFYWLDQRGQVRFFNGSLNSISRNIVDDKTINIPGTRKVWVCGACANDSYYFSYTPSGGTKNTKTLVYNELLATWESEDTFSGFGPSIMVPAYDSTTGLIRLLIFDTPSTSTNMYWYIKDGDTSNVSFELDFKEIANLDAWVRVNAMGVFASKLAGQTLSFTTSRVIKGTTGNTSPVTGTITNATTDTSISMWDNLAVGAEGSSIQPRISGTIPGNTYIYSVIAEVEKGIKRFERS